MGRPRVHTEHPLPPDVVAAIWKQVGDAPRTIPEKMEAFAAIALQHPHYAYTGDIAAALGVSTNKLTPIVQVIISRARKTRLTR